MPVFDKTSAKIKMVILTIPGKENIYWYSTKKEDKKRPDRIIEGMMRRFKNKPLTDITQVIQFYDNQTKKLIQEIR